MPKRILSTLILWSIVVLCVRYFGTTGGVWLITLIAALTLREFFGLVERMGLHPFSRFAIAAGVVITLSPRYLSPHFPALDSGLLLALATVILAVRILGERGPENRVETLGWTLFGLFYVPYMLHYLSSIMMIESPHPLTGLVLCVWLIAVSKFCDTGALLTGLAFGRHKMAPGISPKKTWEGALGGVCTSALVGAVLASLCRGYLPPTLTPALGAAFAVPIALVTIVSDLVESVIKRRADIKDTGGTIPGIGGVFDLSDSLILSAPLGYALFKLFL